MHEQTCVPDLQDQELAAHNGALRRRGSLTIWFDPAMSRDSVPTGRRGRQPTCSDAASQTCLTRKILFGMALRQATGCIESLLHLVGLDWRGLGFSTLSRRQKIPAVNIPYRGVKGPLHRLIDSPGIKVEGEGEGHTRKHGGPQRHVWLQIHLGIDEQTLAVRAVEITESHVGAAPVLSDLLSQIPEGQEIGRVTADGARATRKCHDAGAERGAHAPVPLRGNAKPWKIIARWCGRAKRGAAGIKIPRRRPLVTIERISPQEPRRDMRRIRK